LRTVARLMPGRAIAAVLHGTCDHGTGPCLIGRGRQCLARSSQRPGMYPAWTTGCEMRSSVTLLASFLLKPAITAWAPAGGCRSASRTRRPGRASRARWRPCIGGRRQCHASAPPKRRGRRGAACADPRASRRSWPPRTGPDHDVNPTGRLGVRRSSPPFVPTSRLAGASSSPPPPGTGRSSRPSRATPIPELPCASASRSRRAVVRSDVDRNGRARPIRAQISLTAFRQTVSRRAISRSLETGEKEGDV